MDDTSHPGATYLRGESQLTSWLGSRHQRRHTADPFISSRFTSDGESGHNVPPNEAKRDAQMTALEPRLVAVTGVMSGEVFPLSGPELSLGREPSNVL